jgi:hypothetical protein
MKELPHSWRIAPRKVLGGGINPKAIEGDDEND